MDHCHGWQHDAHNDSSTHLHGEERRGEGRGRKGHWRHFKQARGKGHGRKRKCVKAEGCPKGTEVPPHHLPKDIGGDNEAALEIALAKGWEQVSTCQTAETEAMMPMYLMGRLLSSPQRTMAATVMPNDS